MISDLETGDSRRDSTPRELGLFLRGRRDLLIQTADRREDWRTMSSSFPFGLRCPQMSSNALRAIAGCPHVHRARRRSPIVATDDVIEGIRRNRSNLQRRLKPIES